MEPLVPTLTFEQLRQAKQNASKSLQSLNIGLSSSTTGNLVANILGYNDWNTAKAMTENHQTLPIPQKEISSSSPIYLIRNSKSRILLNIASKIGVSTAKQPNFTFYGSTAIFTDDTDYSRKLIMDWALDVAAGNGKHKIVYIDDSVNRPKSTPLDLWQTSIEQYDAWNKASTLRLEKDNDARLGSALLDAMGAGSHLFIDSKYHGEKILKELTKAGYKNFTILIDGNINKPTGYSFDRILIGEIADEVRINEIKGVIENIDKKWAERSAKRSLLEALNANIVIKRLKPSEIGGASGIVDVGSVDYLNIDGLAGYVGSNKKWVLKNTVPYMPYADQGIYENETYYNRRAFEALVVGWTGGAKAKAIKEGQSKDGNGLKAGQSLTNLDVMRDHFETFDYFELAEALKYVIDNYNEDEFWPLLPQHVQSIIDNEAIFTDIAIEHGFDADRFVGILKKDGKVRSNEKLFFGEEPQG